MWVVYEHIWLVFFKKIHVNSNAFYVFLSWESTISDVVRRRHVRESQSLFRIQHPVCSTLSLHKFIRNLLLNIMTSSTHAYLIYSFIRTTSINQRSGKRASGSQLATFSTTWYMLEVQGFQKGMLMFISFSVRSVKIGWEKAGSEKT